MNKEKYGLSEEDIRAVISYAAAMIRGKEVRDVPA